MSNYAGWTADELKGFLRTLQKARFSGALEVDFRDRMVIYNPTRKWKPRKTA